MIIHIGKQEAEYWMSSLFPGSRPAFRRWQYVLQTMAGPGEWGLNLGVSDSKCELSYICALAAGSVGFCSSGYALSDLKWLKIITQHFLTMKFAQWTMGSRFRRRLGLLVLIRVRLHMHVVMKQGPDYCSFRCPTKKWGVCTCANSRHQPLVLGPGYEATIRHDCTGTPMSMY